MKKIFIFLFIAVILLFISDKIYKIYRMNFISSHEAIVLINSNISDDEVDTFFKLSEGTYDRSKHMIVYSFLRKDAYVFETYVNLPVSYKNIYGGREFTCDLDYSDIRPYRFYNYEIASNIIIARLISKNANPFRRLNHGQSIAEKALSSGFKFGEINVLDVDKSGIRMHCR